MQQSTACLHFRGVQRRCVWAVGRLGVAAWLACVAAAAIDRQARRCCRVWCGDKCVLRRSASGGRTGSACAAQHTPTLNAVVGPTHFTPLHQTRQDGPVCVVSGMPMCSSFKFSVFDSLELSGIQFTRPKRTRHRQDSFVMSGLAV